MTVSQNIIERHLLFKSNCLNNYLKIKIFKYMEMKISENILKSDQMIGKWNL